MKTRARPKRVSPSKRIFQKEKNDRQNAGDQAQDSRGLHPADEDQPPPQVVDLPLDGGTALGAVALVQVARDGGDREKAIRVGQQEEADRREENGGCRQSDFHSDGLTAAFAEIKSNVSDLWPGVGCGTRLEGFADRNVLLRPPPLQMLPLEWMIR